MGALFLPFLLESVILVGDLVSLLSVSNLLFQKKKSTTSVSN